MGKNRFASTAGVLIGGDGENLVHIFTGVTALAAGLISAGQSEAAARRTCVPAQ